MSDSVPVTPPEPLTSGPELPGLSVGRALAWCTVAAASFHVAHLAPYAGYAILGFFIGLLNLTRLNNARHGFRWGVLLGWLVYVPHLAFFWNVFVPEGPMGGTKLIGVLGVFMLWMVLPVWLGLFLCLATWLRRRTRARWWILLVPVAWTGIEYFRGELYPLKFSWLSAGYAFADATWLIPLALLGMYGTGFLLFLLAAFTFWAWRKSKLATGLSLAGATYALIFMGLILSAREQRSGVVTSELAIGGVQLEFASNRRILEQLDRLIAEHPQTELCVLSEYTFPGPVPDVIRDWCGENKRYLIAGGTDPLGTTNYYNTAFVVGPDGEIVFKQAKSVPIQFFTDGLPAPGQTTWDSPWGRLGLCICYDLGYARVTDQLIRQGADAIIAPTMDVERWGGYQHWLHARVAPIRAAEYGVPIFRLTSSGISQHVRADGKIVRSCPFPGQGELLAAQLRLQDSGRLPLDRWFAPGCVVATLVITLMAATASLRRTLVKARPTGN